MLIVVVSRGRERERERASARSKGPIMSNQNNRFLLPQTSATSATSRAASSFVAISSSTDQLDENQLSVDTDFDSYWEEEARNPHRNRIRIGRQYQATIPQLMSPGEKDRRILSELETLSFCPKKSTKVSNAELDHYFTVAKSLNIFASLVETRSLLGRDVTIADLNFIRRKEGLSLASVIQPTRHAAASSSSNSIFSPQSSQQQSTQATSSQQSEQKASPTTCENKSFATAATSPRDALTSQENYSFNQPFMKALSHFISLHHPCHHDRDCKKLLKDIPFEDESTPVVSITAGNLRQGSSSSAKESKLGRSRSSLKQSAAASNSKTEDPDMVSKESEHDQQLGGGDSAVRSPSFDDWTREEVELFSKAIEVCGKNFGSIKKEFLPSKSVRSIVEYYYIGSRDLSEHKKKSSHPVDTSDACSNPEKLSTNNNNDGPSGGGDGPSPTGSNSNPNASVTGSAGTSNSSSRTNSSSNDSNNKSLPDTGDGGKQLTSTDKTISKQQKNEDPNTVKAKSKTIDARMSIYNFDDEFKEESPVRFECPKPGAEVKPLKAKPILPNSSGDVEGGNSNVGSLKFFMDGQLVLKLNACQEQQEGVEKCHWIQSGDKINTQSRSKRYAKKAGDGRASEQSHNGSQSNSVVSSNHDEDSKNEELSNDEDSKESANSFTNVTTKQKSNPVSSPSPKRPKTKSDSGSPQQQRQLPSHINYNRVAINNRVKERNESLTPNPIVNPAAMPWLQANSFAVAAALLGGLPFPTAAVANNLVNNQVQTNVAQNINNNNNNNNNNISTSSLASTKPMDLSMEHSSPKIQSKSSNRSRSSRPKNN